VDGNLQQLLLYQQYDSKLLKLEKLSEKLRRDGELLLLRRSAAEEKLGLKVAALKNAQKELRLAELDLVELENSVKSLLRKRDWAKNFAQQVALDGEFAAAEARKIACEERVLAAVESCEVAAGEANSCKVELDSLDKTMELQRGLVVARCAELDGEKSAVKDMMLHLRNGIAKEWIGAYDCLRKSNLQPPYVARLDGFSCTGCHMRMASNHGGMGNSPRRRCEFCNRIIYEENDVDDVEEN
jgi:predicted  nucleic acid-binding Zn-ribbon protein